MAAIAGTQAAVSTWDCGESGILAPVQYVRCGTGGKGGTGKPLCSDPSIVDGNGFYTLDVSSGVYTPLFTMGVTELDSMNACAINPIDSFAYCAARVELSSNTVSKIRLIRFGSTHANPHDAEFEYVAILPVPVDNAPGSGYDSRDRIPNSAAFSLSGNFYVRHHQSLSHLC